MANKGLGWDSLLKMVHNPGGHWHPGKGSYPRYSTQLQRLWLPWCFFGALMPWMAVCRHPTVISSVDFRGEIQWLVGKKYGQNRRNHPDKGVLEGGTVSQKYQNM